MTEKQTLSTEIKMDELQLLQFAIDNGIISISDIRRTKDMRDKNEILKLHKYAIWKSDDGIWYTYVPDATKKKGFAQRKRRSESELKEAIVDYYIKNSKYLKTKTEKKELKRKKNSKHSFCVMFTELLTFKSEIVGVSDNTLDKYAVDYKRYFEDTEIECESIQQLDDEKITMFVIRRIKDLKLSKRAGNDMINYMRMVFDRGVKKKIITINPFQYIDKIIFNKHYTQSNNKSVEKRTISQTETVCLNQRFQYYHENKPRYIPIYAVELASLTGFRVGELAALRWDKIKNGMIFIDSSEKYNRKTKEYYIDTTKNGKERSFPVTQEIQMVLDAVRAVETKYGYLSEFVFSNEKGRIHNQIISDCARNSCIYMGMEAKSIHTHRRTVSSRMKCNGVATPIVASLMGHTEEVNKNNYTYDVSSAKQKVEIVSRITKEIKMENVS